MSSGRFRPIELPHANNHLTTGNVPAKSLRIYLAFSPDRSCGNEVCSVFFYEFLCNATEIECSDEPQTD